MKRDESNKLMFVGIDTTNFKLAFVQQTISYYVFALFKDGNIKVETMKTLMDELVNKFFIKDNYRICYDQNSLSNEDYESKRIIEFMFEICGDDTVYHIGVDLREDSIYECVYQRSRFDEKGYINPFHVEFRPREEFMA